MSLEIRILSSLKAIDPAQWDPLASPDFPFHRHAFLYTLEETGSVGEKSGWIPKYFTAWKDNRLVAALPCYEKNHSYGEYIFDWEWARAYAQHRLPYYPKWLAAVPFTPATGPKILVAPGEDTTLCRTSLVRALTGGARNAQLSSAHALFLTDGEPEAFAAEGYLMRHTLQFHWRNQSFADFAAFLDSLKARKRKQIARERRQLAEEGLEICTLSGHQLTPEHGQLLHRCYLSTVEKMGAIPYLAADFYPKLIERMPESIALSIAYRGTTGIAAAVHFRGARSLYGRHWGCLEEVRNLHFELCYYQALELAIREGLEKVEAGAQGEHKIQRGYLPTVTFSAHWIADDRFRSAIARFLDQEREALKVGLADFAGSPFGESGPIAQSLNLPP